MCRISGSVNFDEWWVKETLETQSSGGPDGRGFTSSGDVIFGHCLLSIIGLQSQPIQNERYILTYAGEWYNFRDYYPDSKSDTSSLLEHFNARGLKAIDDINGQFSIGLYDKIEKKVHLWADRFNQRNIYYYHEGDVFAFASTPAALYGLKDKWELDRDALQSYWLLGSVMGENGLLKGIKKLCASEHLTYDLQTNTYKVERYWEPKFNPSPL